MSPGLRRLALTAHITASVGWLGAVAAVLALALAGLVSDDAATVRAVALTLEVAGWSVLVPLSLASFVTGLVQSLGTTWGLFRHYWVLAKLILNVLATTILLLYMQTLGALADVAADPEAPTASGALSSPSATLHAGAALLLLLLATVIAVYKPRGLTGYGRRKRDEQRRMLQGEAAGR